MPQPLQYYLSILYTLYIKGLKGKPTSSTGNKTKKKPKPSNQTNKQNTHTKTKPNKNKTKTQTTKKKAESMEVNNALQALIVINTFT